MDTLLLSRVQLGSLTAFHLLFPAVTLALGWVLVAFRLRPIDRWTRAFQLWMPVYALSVAFQVVSGWALWSQFAMTLPAFVEQANAVVSPMRGLYLIGNLMQVAGLAIAATGFRVLPARTITSLIAVSAFGGVLSLLSPVFLMTWMSNPVGVHTPIWVLTRSDWITVLTNPRGWQLVAFLVLASGATVGLLMACLSTLRQNPPGQEADATAKTGLMLASVSALLALGLMGLKGPAARDIPLLATLTIISMAASGLLVVLRKPEAGLAVLPLPARIVLLALPTAGWSALMLGWPFDKILHSAWIIRGELRLDEAAAILAPGTVSATLPIYLTTIAVLVLAYVAVLITMARSSAVAKQTWRPWQIQALQSGV